MKYIEKIITIGIIVFVFILFLSALLPKGKWLDISEQNISISGIQSDIKGLEVEAKLEYEKTEAIPSLSLHFENNSTQQLIFSELHVYYTEDEDFEKLPSKQTTSLLYTWSILTPELATLENEQAGENICDNTYSLILTPWQDYEMGRVGSYRIEFFFHDTSGNALGSVWIEIEQAKK